VIKKKTLLGGKKGKKGLQPISRYGFESVKACSSGGEGEKASLLGGGENAIRLGQNPAHMKSHSSN